MNPVTLNEAHKHSIANQTEIDASENCGCFWCRRVFPAETVKFITEKRGRYTGLKTALCPHCEIDSVIGDASGFFDEKNVKEFLEAMNQRWFKTTSNENVIPFPDGKE